MMGGGNRGHRGGVSCHSVGSYRSSSFIPIKRKNENIICYCRLKTLIKKFRTLENSDRLFYTCPRYRKDSHCNFFNWIDEDGYDGGNGDAETDAKVERNDEWKVNIAWRMGNLEVEVRFARMLMTFMFIGLIIVILVVGLISTFCIFK
ncbi:hypothetical protein Ahy_B01g057016 [Arachis hypogaea]|uniref:GRF-type domain-containing protein n=1 Tax=Arachis hypogaea TaxID=3818 RepID=A0A445B016_ARAHY|nr:hypothetical protein Ahy_B01g057016 [Arachis hypogaea]